jgi:predicted DNA-binding transcriptional regulator YafY
MENDVIVIKYESSSTSEITEREISNVSSKISNGGFYISAFCHLRDAIKNFSLNNIIEIKINGVLTDKVVFYLKHIRNKDKFKNELENLLAQKQNEYNRFLELYERMKSND